MKFCTHPRSPSFNKTRNTKDAIPASPKQDFLLHTTTTHLPTIRALQTTKITKLGLPTLPPVAFKTHQNYKADMYFVFRGIDLGLLK